MMRNFGPAPTNDDIDAMARAVLASLPSPFAETLRDVVLLVEDLADEAVLRDLEIDHPFDLTGLYEGVPIGERSVSQSGTLPDRIRLFRRAILDEWIEDGESLERLVRHIVIHEAGHHFGLSDAEMHALEAQA